MAWGCYREYSLKVPFVDGVVDYADCVHSTTRSDWLAWETAREPLERTVFAFR